MLFLFRFVALLPLFAVQLLQLPLICIAAESLDQDEILSESRQLRSESSTTSIGSIQSTRNSNGQYQLNFHDSTYLSSHNAHANRAAAGWNIFAYFGTDQYSSIYHQLSREGVRHLLIDVQVKSGELRLVHGPLDYGGFVSEFRSNVIPFLEENNSAVVMVGMQTMGRDGTTSGSSTEWLEVQRYLRDALSVLKVDGVALKDVTFKYNDALWANHANWPTVQEIAQANQRLFLFTDRSEIADDDYGIMYDRQVMMENYWEGIDDCLARYQWGNEKVSLPENSYWNRLFLMNHFEGEDYGWSKLYPRIQICMSSNGGVKPNFIALDWISRNSETLKVIEYLNTNTQYASSQSRLPPTKRPTRRPTKTPTRRPTKRPSNRPTPNPTRRPTPNPSRRPSGLRQILTNKPTKRTHNRKKEPE